VVFYPSFELFNTLRGQTAASQENLQDSKVKGYLSKASQRKIRDMVENWVNCVKAKQIRTKKPLDFYLSFVTLTLPAYQMHSDKELKRKALNPFLIYAKRKWKIKTWIWKAEPQKNGNIHFHLLFDRFIPWQEVRKMWIKILEPLGYIDEFFKKHNHRNPNCTDIHGLQKDKKGDKITFVGAYLAKYMSKSEKLNFKGEQVKDRPIDGKIWGRSENLQDLKCFTGFDDQETSKFFECLKSNAELNEYSGEFFRVFTGNWFELAGENRELMKKIDLFFLEQYEKIIV
jgi:hypothetical protein